MIAPTPISSAPEIDRDAARELLRTVMTPRGRNYLLEKATKWLNGDRDKAEDLVQETFLSLLKTTSYDPSKSNPITYAYWRLWGLMRKLAYSQSGHHRQPLPLKHEPVSRELVMSPERRENCEMMSTALGSLPDRYARILRGKFNGDTQQEIAEQIGCTRHRVHQLEPLAMSAILDYPLPIPA
ncbi:sigma-70 family RNA polymerase sigma factor [Planctomicrobium sp. SH664]|uniref:sigma-70 family RNA polymerase sigma factor n=1 Tax=Planctomicrobium sp. SH664 TaxID=3448125 RepID=UPI003F5C68D7